MAYIGTTEWYQRVSQGLVPGYSVIHKFGYGSVGTTLIPVSPAGVYQTPTTAQALEFVSSSVNDTAAGSGAREITVIGLDANWAEVSQTVTTNGTTAVALGTNLIRLYRWYVSSSGTYASSAAGSHAGTLTIRAAGAGATWDTIGATPFPFGQSEIAAYTIPAGKTGYLVMKHYTVDGTKSYDIYFFKRESANDVSAPYPAMRIVERELDIQGSVTSEFVIPRSGFAGPCDVGVMAKVASGTGSISAEFILLLKDN